MDNVILIYAAAVAWFTYACLFIAVLIYQFITFPRTFGRMASTSLRDLAELSAAREVDLPRFKIVVPAFQESLVINDTLRRLASLNYPRTHFDIHVVTYEDEPADPAVDSTYSIAMRTAAEINNQAKRNLVKPLHVPLGFDGGFPGDLRSEARFIGKPRGLNYALRTIHEENEQDERIFYVGKMARLGHLDTVDKALDAVEAAASSDPYRFAAVVDEFFDPEGSNFVGPCALSAQLRRAFALLAGAVSPEGGPSPSTSRLASYIEREAPRFFLKCPRLHDVAPNSGRPTLSVMEDRGFLHDVMCMVEEQGRKVLEEGSIAVEARLKHERPILGEALARARDGEEIFQLSRRINARWVAVYDADADVPVDLFRHLAGRILTEPDVMGFQGPVAPVSNYDAIHPLCRLGGLWMGFWHSTGYPRLLARKSWAHVLAGTNWCFRIDGFEKGDRLVRDCSYDEARRHFILAFDPRQLTEDLEVAVRIFSDWRINAEWHPYPEFEQSPPTPAAMIAQRSRWALGSLQTLGYMLRSRMPVLQKIKYAFLPFDFVMSSSGPVAAVALWVLVYLGDLATSPILVAWSILLTFGNAIYVLPYVLAYGRFVGAFRRMSGIDLLLRDGRRLSTEVRQRLRSANVSREEAALLGDIAALLGSGLQPGGFVSRYLEGRCIDRRSSDKDILRLEQETPNALFDGDLPELARLYRQLALDASPGESETGADFAPGSLAVRLQEMKNALEMAAATGRWRARQKSEKRQIWLWAFVYLFFQMAPYYKGLVSWLLRRRHAVWHKTPRTGKGRSSSSR